MRNTFVLTVVLLFSALVSASAASATSSWSANSFVDPTGNVQCKYAGPAGGILCREITTGKAALVHRTGADKITRIAKGIDWEPDYRYVLAYGDHYRAGRFFCRSFTKQMICGNTDNGHGFAISRRGVATW